MNITNLTDTQLHNTLLILAKKEKLLDMEIINHLQEMEMRKLYSEYGYSSLYDYCLKALKFSGDQSYRRIKSMRLAEEMPVVKKNLKSGNLSIANATMLGSLFDKIPHVPEDEKIEMVNEAVGKSKRECEEYILDVKEVHGLTAKPKKTVIRRESPKTSRIAFSLPKESIEKLEKLKSHHKVKKLEDLMQILIDQSSQTMEQDLKPQRKRTTVPRNSRSIPKSVKFHAHQKANGKCESCGSVHQLEYDHRKPFSLGGTNDSNNIRLLCRNCNLRSAIKIFGKQKMNSYKH
jgi:5-methylcytosine-specific restriction endonuclease McrA